MPLDRAHITAASAIMLPAYAVLNALFGIVFLFDPEQRLSLAPSMEPARAWMPLWAWGLLWIGLTLMAVSAWATANRHRAVFALRINAVAWAAWGLLVEAAVFAQPNVTYLAGALPMAWAVANYASSRSLLSQER